MREIWQLTARPVLVSLVPRLSPHMTTTESKKVRRGRAWYPFTRDAWHIDVTVIMN